MSTTCPYCGGPTEGRLGVHREHLRRCPECNYTLTPNRRRESDGLSMIRERRERHTAKGWYADHDDQHRRGELAIVAAALAVYGTRASVDDDGLDLVSPSGHDTWNLIGRHPDSLDQLAIAGSLIAAEIDRLIRARGGKGGR